MQKLLIMTILLFSSQITWANNRANELSSIEKESIFHYNQGVLYSKKQNLKQAEKSYLRAIRLLPMQEFALANLANVYCQLGFYEKAQKFANRALEQDPSDEVAQHALVKSFTLQKKWSEALVVAKKYESKNSGTEFLTTISNIYGHLENKNKEALAYSLKALSKNAHNLQASQNAMIFAARDSDCSQLIKIYENYFSSMDTSGSLWQISYLNCKLEVDATAKDSQ